MIRLVMLLIAGIVVTLSVAGRDLDRPQGSDGDAGFVAQSDVRPERAGDWLGAIDARGDAIDRAVEASLSPEPVIREPRREASLAPLAPIPSDAQSFVVTASRVNLRQGPSTAQPVVDQVLLDERVEVVSWTDDGWAQIVVPRTGNTAYIFGQFITPKG
ncbi:SH3 domain-containing protein [Palleronia sediminis]|uniref:SH3 domain-containing protein n=1 Tax=Palleronia sediminis TaxID=2547833 RepID=A0A4R6A582_9RHOB|nr:SH3 domain-containing protein [Palleronia sediminis]TDL76276.1 SH3 domain-containing protein [Palleronia sediminis]